MAALNDFVANYIPSDIRSVRDYESGDGWIHKANRLLKKIERNRLFVMSKKKERGVEVEDDYWITIPPDLRQVVAIYDPDDPTKYTYSHEIINERIKLHRSFSKDSSPDTFVLSNGTTTEIEINDGDATADLWNDYLLVLTNGTYSGYGIIIKDTGAGDGEGSVLTFLHTQPGTIDSTAGYLADTYMMLKYFGEFTPMTAYDDEIPIDDRWEDILVNWLCKESLSVTDKRRRHYEKLFKEDWDEAMTEHCTPTRDQLRQKPIYWPEVESSVTTHTYTQD